MIEFHLDSGSAPETAPSFAVSVIGVGGAGTNVIDKLALEGMPGADVIAMNCDARSLTTSTAGRKLQLGKTLTLGLGCGGDPELGAEAAVGSADEIRELLAGRTMVFLCVGLGGGTGSGAAPAIAALAREAGAFVVVFATLPFVFEGRRRGRQADVALTELRQHANALVTFGNDRMGELVVPKKGVREAFEAADKIIGQSIRAVTSLVTQPGLIQIGMDDLITALRNTDSRCLFGFGQAKGESRAVEALAQALRSPLLDRGQMVTHAKNVLVHICGGNSLTLFEIETLMRELGKQVSEDAQILFGAATDAKLNDHLSVTILTSLSQPAPAPEPIAEEVIEPEVPDAEPAGPAAPVPTPAGQLEVAPFESVTPEAAAIPVPVLAPVAVILETEESATPLAVAAAAPAPAVSTPAPQLPVVPESAPVQAVAADLLAAPAHSGETDPAGANSRSVGELIQDLFPEDSRDPSAGEEVPDFPATTAAVQESVDVPEASILPGDEYEAAEETGLAGEPDPEWTSPEVYADAGPGSHPEPAAEWEREPAMEEEEPQLVNHSQEDVRNGFHPAVEMEEPEEESVEPEPQLIRIDRVPARRPVQPRGTREPEAKRFVLTDLIARNTRPENGHPAETSAAGPGRGSGGAMAPKARQIPLDMNQIPAIRPIGLPGRANGTGTTGNRVESRTNGRSPENAPVPVAGPSASPFTAVRAQPAASEPPVQIPTLRPLAATNQTPVRPLPVPEEQTSFDERLQPAAAGERFKGANPTREGEDDLDFPTFLRKKR